MQSLTPKLINIFEKVLSPPMTQLEDETRAQVAQIIQNLFAAKQDLFVGHEQVLVLAGVQH